MGLEFDYLNIFKPVTSLYFMKLAQFQLVLVLVLVLALL
jgi:hypothetical protein